MKALHVFLVMLLVCARTPSVIVDRASASDPFLDRLASELDARGIDVRRSWTSTTKPSTLTGRPQLAQLNGYPTTDEPVNLQAKWQTEFLKGAFREGALIGLEGASRPNAPLSMTPEQFEHAWDSAPQESRVFISFTKADARHVLAVRNILKSKGFLVFTYVSREHAPPAFKPETVGKFLQTARHRLVLDSTEARKSIGVQLEAKAAEVYRRGGTINVDPDPDNCCKVCYYRNGVQTYCDPPVCGPQCIGAR